MYSTFIRPILFLLDPEKAHWFATFFLKVLKNRFLAQIVRTLMPQPPEEELNIMGLKFRSRIGMAAGFDKYADLYTGLDVMGFGFVEIGTITPKPQLGNPMPRLFRLKSDKALINRMGFNNGGAMEAASKLRGRKSEIIIGGNIGKNKMTPNENALGDYITCFKALHPYVDYFTVNVSSPNTPGLRELQEKKPLQEILQGLQQLNKSMDPIRPILLKIAPDMEKEQLDDVIEIVKTSGIQGVIATNTTISRSKLKTSEKELEAIGNGGLSGKPLTKRALEVVSYLRKNAGEDMVIIGVGGIFSGQDAVNMIHAGADLIQVYTGFIYKGPQLVQEINRTLKVLEQSN